MATTRCIGLIGCVKAKHDLIQPAKDLYASPLSAKRSAFVEHNCDEWWILSAEHGLVTPDQLLAPYNSALGEFRTDEPRAWGQRVLMEIDNEITLRSGDVVELHARAEYRNFGLTVDLSSRGCSIQVATTHMRIGEQLRFYSDARSPTLRSNAGHGSMISMG